MISNSIFALKMAGTVVTDSDDHPLKETVHVCPICFESYKTPRFLPCLHTFCHACLSSYIMSSCQQKNDPSDSGAPCAEVLFRHQCIINHPKNGLKIFR